MEVIILSQQEDLAIDEDAVAHLVAAVLDHKQCHCDEVSIHFVDIEEITALHEEFFDDPTPTDCITFPIDTDEESSAGSYRLLGEVFVCPAVAKEYASQNGLEVYHELSLYIIHGLLHLLGYDDIHEDDEQKMREAEQELLHMAREKKLLLGTSR